MLVHEEIAPSLLPRVARKLAEQNVELRVDDRDVHFTGDIPFVGKLLGSPLLKGLKGVVEDKFQKRLK